MKKIPYQYQRLVFATLMSFTTALIVSGVMSAMQSPSLDEFYHHWSKAFYMAWPIVFMVILLLAQWVNKLVGYLVDKPSSRLQD